MKEPITLQANQVVINDEERLIAVYPYRDSDDTKVTPGTKRIHVVSCGVPGISPEKVVKAYEMAAEYLRKILRWQDRKAHNISLRLRDRKNWSGIVSQA